ncbi:hypothetical protein B566_EDAN007169 [Ephemera danica]|nr:hypothetical protein B566_EDAN007169 [Ephemera danica]
MYTQHIVPTSERSCGASCGRVETVERGAELTHRCFDELCSRQGPLYTDFQDINCNEGEFKIVCSMIKTALYQCVKQNATSTKQLWILGSSNLASLQQVLFNLNLELSSDAMQEHHSIEMDLTELSRLLSALEQARDSLQSH